MTDTPKPGPRRTKAPAKAAVKTEPAAAPSKAPTPARAPRKRSAPKAPALRVVGGTDVPAASAPPPPPDGMGPRGRTLWRKVLAVYDFRPDELVVFESACRAEDRVKNLRDELDKRETMILGSMGQLVVNPLFVEIRAHEAHVAALLSRLRLKDVEAGGREGKSSSKAREAAQARWTVPHGHTP